MSWPEKDNDGQPSAIPSGSSAGLTLVPNRCPGQKPDRQVRRNCLTTLVPTGGPSRPASATSDKGGGKKTDRQRGSKHNCGHPRGRRRKRQVKRERSGDALITVMKSADLRDRDDSPARWRLHFAWMGAVAVEGLMWAGGVVVREVGAQQASEMPFVEHDDAIEAFPSNRPDDALGEGILPGGSWGDEDPVDPQAFHPPCETHRRRWRPDRGAGTWGLSLP